jgi:hypothetical protein
MVYRRSWNRSPALVQVRLLSSASAPATAWTWDSRCPTASRACSPSLTQPAGSDRVSVACAGAAARAIAREVSKAAQAGAVMRTMALPFVSGPGLAPSLAGLSDQPPSARVPNPTSVSRSNEPLHVSNGVSARSDHRGNRVGTGVRWVCQSRYSFGGSPATSGFTALGSAISPAKPMLACADVGILLNGSSELGELLERGRDAHAGVAEVHDHSRDALDDCYPTQAILVVRDPFVLCECLGR